MWIVMLFALVLAACDGGSDSVTMTGTQKCTVTVCTNGVCQEKPC